MIEQQIIQQRGFKNVVQGGKVTGFQVRVRSPYYRGIWASLLEDCSVTVDGETYPSDNLRWTIGGKTFTTPQLADEPELRWAYSEPVTLTLDKTGGLEPGLHTVGVSVTWRWSYIPAERQPTTNISERKLVLVV